MYVPLFLCLYESFWKGFESYQRRLTLLVIKMRLFVWRVVNKTLKFPLILLTINSPLTATFLILSCYDNEEMIVEVNAIYAIA